MSRPGSGSAAFFSFGVAPLAFNVMERTAAGQVVAAVLPRYSITGLGLCAFALDGVEERHGFAVALPALGVSRHGFAVAALALEAFRPKGVRTAPRPR